ncbi:alpha/beta fold hydrolase [Nocardia sp. NEAU-G5]|uniref:Thioesterase TesA n=1 Tax=Nocardia albiluteola TaxID=2842303 RepID=A0ABS6BF86_9NOCA|nr:alpha/beta fold hydrolase [Nocardia albiluteola]
MPIAKGLGSVVDVLAIQYPGRQDRLREPGITDLAYLADLIAAELACLDDGLPAVFFGHSMGAILAFEVAWRLENSGRVPRSERLAA